MSPTHCLECGLLDEGPEGRKQCYVSKKSFQEELSKHWECNYFFPAIIEDGKSLSPAEHYLLRKDEIDRKK